MTDAEREEILAKLAVIKAAVAELETSLSPREAKPIVLFRFSGLRAIVLLRLPGSKGREMKHLKRFALGLLMLLATLSFVLIVGLFAWMHQNWPAIVSYLSWAISGVLLAYLLGVFVEDSWG